MQSKCGLRVGDVFRLKNSACPECQGAIGIVTEIPASGFICVSGIAGFCEKISFQIPWPLEKEDVEYICHAD